eukprot:5514058-Ditylum_brightwellii.AAC.1
MANWLMPWNKCITRNEWAEYLTQMHAMDIILDEVDIWSKHVYNRKGIHGTGCAENGGQNLTGIIM